MRNDGWRGMERRMREAVIAISMLSGFILIYAWVQKS